MSKLRRTLVTGFAAVLLLTGCSGSSDEADNGAETDAAASTSAAASGSGRLSAFQTAIDAMHGSYTFDTEVTVNGERLTRVVGLNVAGDTSFAVETDTGSVEVVAVGEQTWTRTAGGAWEVSDTGVTGGDPLAPLAAVDTATFDPESDSIRIDVPGSAFGIDRDTISITATVDGQTVLLTYEADGAAVSSSLAPAPDGAVVSAPSVNEG